MTDEVKKEETVEEKLTNLGRQFAHDLLTRAIKEAPTPDHVNNQLHIMNCMAINVLATNAYNRIEQMKANKSAVILELRDQIEDELDQIFAHKDELEYVSRDKVKE